MLKIANCAGFWGDRPSAARELLACKPGIDYITLDYLAEVSLSIMALQRKKDSRMGYAKDFIEVAESVPKGTKMITNAGGLNPHGLAKEIVHLGKVAVVNGDALEVEGAFTANAYLGADPIVEALEMGADIVITGRVADPSLTVAPALFHYKWAKEDYDAIAGATVAGHLIECGTQVTGGYSTNWLDIPDKARMGFPIAEIASDGSSVITKANGTGGRVTLESVKQQLLYEIGDPGCYLSPDVTLSFLDIHLEQESENRIRVSGAKGRAPSDSYKVSATYEDGYRADAHLTFFGMQAKVKAQTCGQIIIERVASLGFQLERTVIECIGSDQECVLHIGAADSRKEALECFAKEIAPLITSGPQGVTGYLGGRPKVRPVFGYKPLLIPKTKVTPKVTLYA